MKKRIVKTTLAVAVVAASAAIGYASYTQYQNKQLAYSNPLIEENINALAEPTGETVLWKRTDYNCTYTVKGKAGGSIKVKIVGVGVVELTIGADGTASYTYPDGKTICESEGKQQCESRYCPQLSFM